MVILINVVLLIIGFYFFQIQRKDIQVNDVVTNIYNVKQGYGYTISINSKIIIKQDFIPVIQIKQPFCSSVDAQNIANLVKTKLLNTKSPRITLAELEQYNVILNCNFD